MNAAFFVNAPPSGLTTCTGIAPPELTGLGIAPLTCGAESTKAGVRIVCVVPGLMMIFAPGWKLRPVITYGGEFVECLARCSSARAGADLQARLPRRELSARRHLHGERIPTAVGPPKKSFRCPSGAICMLIENRSVSPGASGACDQL